MLAVDLYNRVASERSLEAFVVHTHTATGSTSATAGHFERIDGEIKTWELARCVRETFPTVDYKTDVWRTDADLDAKVERYAVQLGAYAGAVEVAVGEPVHSKVLLFASEAAGAVARAVT